MNAKSKSTRATWIDPDDAPELTDEFFDNATPMIGDRIVDRDEYTAAVKRVGRPKAQVTKVAVKLRLDPDVLEALRATGAGWQTRVNSILRERFALR